MDKRERRTFAADCAMALVKPLITVQNISCFCPASFSCCYLLEFGAAWAMEAGRRTGELDGGGLTISIFWSSSVTRSSNFVVASSIAVRVSSVSSRSRSQTHALCSSGRKDGPKSHRTTAPELTRRRLRKFLNIMVTCYQKEGRTTMRLLTPLFPALQRER